MRTGVMFGLLPLSILLAGCSSEREFSTQLAAMSDRVDADAAAAHRCADDLRAVAAGDPFVTGAVLEMQNGMPRPLGAPPMPSRIVAGRTLEELARREGAVEAARSTIRSARGVGPAALGNAIDATRLAQGARDRLCQARDVATTVIAMNGQRSPPASSPPASSPPTGGPPAGVAAVIK